MRLAGGTDRHLGMGPAASIDRNSFDQNTVHAILKDLDIAVTSDDGTALVVNVPAYRHDVTRPPDVVEEILRIYGFDKIPMPERLVSTAAHRPACPPKHSDCKRPFLGQPWLPRNDEQQHDTGELHAGPGQDGADGWDLSRQIALMNPLSSDLGVMRQSLLFQGLEAVVRNTNHQRPDLRLFELGKVYQHRQNADAESENAAQRYEETERLALFMTGAAAPENWNNASGGIDAYAMKNEVYTLASSVFRQAQ